MDINTYTQLKIKIEDEHRKIFDLLVAIDDLHAMAEASSSPVERQSLQTAIAACKESLQLHRFTLRTHESQVKYFEGL